MFEEFQNFPIKETSCIIKSSKDCEYIITFSVFKDDKLSIKISTVNLIPSKKFALVCSFEELIKNKFFKIFANVEEVFRELETKIQNSIIIEETNVIYLNIPIGLNEIKDIILKIEQTERNKDEIIEDLKNEINQLKDENNQLKINLNDIKNKLNDFEIKKSEKYSLNAIVDRLIVENFENQIRHLSE